MLYAYKIVMTKLNVNIKLIYSFIIMNDPEEPVFLYALLYCCIEKRPGNYALSDRG